MSMEQERAIARKYMGKFPLFMVVWGLGGSLLWLSLLWLSLFPLMHSGIISWWLGCISATIILCYCYLPTHEAQHGIYGRPNTRWHWLNELIGHTSVFPILIPYRLHRAVHLKHHTYTNDPDKDPDIYIKADTVWDAMKCVMKSRRPENVGNQTHVLEDSEQTMRLTLEALAVTRLAWLAMVLLAWNGFALELLVLWWVPRQIALTYIPIVLSWAPHQPMKETGRYADTRGWKSSVGTILSAGMEYHLVHHLFPSIPLNKTPAAYRELKPLLEAENMKLNGL